MRHRASLDRQVLYRVRASCHRAVVQPCAQGPRRPHACPQPDRWKASGSSSPCCSPISRVRPSSLPTAIRKKARALLDPVLEHMCEAVEQYGGTVSQVMGDGIMAIFGAPVAAEDHAVRACRAALSMQDLVRHYGDDLQRSHGVPVQIRVGLDSGEVVLR